MSFHETHDLDLVTHNLDLVTHDCGLRDILTSAVGVYTDTHLQLLQRWVS